MTNKKDEKCCGNCCWFMYEDTDGWGQCALSRFNVVIPPNYCGHGEDCPQCVTRAQARHYIATLIQANRYRRDRSVPAIYHMPDPKELGRAIDFSVKYMKRMMEL